MASLGHIAVGMAAARAYVGKDGGSFGKAAFAFSAISMWPDLDTVGFLFGVDYGAPLGHRGATHSLMAALFVGLASYLLAKRREWPAARITLFVTVVAASHCLLDTLTRGGGLGCALLFPFSLERFWAPDVLRIIPIAPIGPYMVSARGARVASVELILFAPFWLYALWPRRQAAANPSA